MGDYTPSSCESMIFDRLIRRVKKQNGLGPVILDLKSSGGSSGSRVLIIPKKINWKKIGFLFVFLGFIWGGVAIYNSTATKGEVKDFYPSLCLGTWKNPSNAQGSPQTVDGQSFDSKNSSVFEGLGHIFCGGFMPADYEAQGEIQTVAATFFWGFPPVPGSTQTNPDTSENFETIIEEEKESSDSTFISPRLIFAQAEGVQGDTSPAMNLPVVAENIEPKKEDSALPVEEDKKSDQLPADSSPTSTEATNTPGGLDDKKPDDPKDTVIVTEKNSPPDDNFLRVSLSYDGQTWFEAGRVSLDTLPHFTINLPVKNWQELRSLQLRIEDMPSNLKEAPPVHLDGILVEVKYEIPPVYGGEEKLVNEVNVQEVEIESLPIKRGRHIGVKSFRSDDSPLIDIPLQEIIDANNAPATSTAPGLEEATSTPPFLQDVDEIMPEEPGNSETEEDEILTRLPAGTRYGQLYFRKTAKSLSGLRFFYNAFLQKILKKTFAQTELPSVTLADNRPYYAEIIAPGNKKSEEEPHIMYLNGVVKVSIPKNNASMVPGRYILRVWMLQNGKVYYSEQQFLWGVIAINTDSTIYAQGSTGKLMIGVLDDNGHTICDADIEVIATSPSGQEFFYTSAGGQVRKSSTCGPVSVTDEPDYWLNIPAGEMGKYQVEVLAKTDWGDRTINDSYEVEEQPAFEVERIGPTRIYPLAKYSMRIRIKANTPFTGSLTETMPDSFDVSVRDSEAASYARNGLRYIQWPARLKAGQMQEYYYEFDAPDVSPVIHRLGPLTMGGWQEGRQWQIASDAVSADGRLFHASTASAGNIYFQTRSNADTWNTTASSTIVPVASGISWMRAAHSPVRDEVFIGTQHNNGTVGITKCVNGCDATADFTGDTSDNFTKTNVVTAQTCNGTLGACSRGFDVAYEQLSGEALAVFASSANGVIQYCTYSTSTWSGSNCATPSTFTMTGSAARFLWLKLFPEGGEQVTANRSNRILLVGMDNANDIFSAVWDGSSWIAQRTLTTSAPATTTEMFAAAWENPTSTTGRAVVVFGVGTGTTDQARYQTLTSTSTWSASSSVGTFGASSNLIWATAQADPKSKRICLATQSAGNEVSAWMWANNGTTDGFTRVLTDTTGAEGAVAFATACAWEKSNGGAQTSTAIYFASDNANSDTSDYYLWLGGVTSTNDMPGGLNDDGMQFGDFGVRGSPNGDTILSIGASITCDIEANYWTGSAWGAAADYNIAPAGSVAGSDNIPPDCTAASEAHGYYYLFRPFVHWSRNWQWYSGATSTTPTSGRGQNTNATSSPGAVLRLRMQLQELNNVAETDARKKLQFVTSSTCPDINNCSNYLWMDVGEFNNGTAAWIYATTTDSGCTGCVDGAFLASNLLTSSTQSSTFVVSGTATASTSMDFNALGTAELDFPIKAQNVVSGETYYFRIYDATDNTVNFRRQDVAGATACAGGATCSYPGITMIDSPTTISNVSINGGSNIILNPNTTTTVNVSFQVTDNDGCNTIFSSGNITSTLHRSGASGGASCSLSNNFCYRVTTSTNDCTNQPTANATATFQLWYYTDATDASSSYDGQTWKATIEARSGSNGTSTASSSIELLTLVAVESPSSSYAYPEVAAGGNTGYFNLDIGTYNAGNSTHTIKISGTAMSSGSNIIPTSSQRFASNTFTYGGSEQELSATPITLSGVYVSAGPGLKSGWLDTVSYPSLVSANSVSAYGGRIYSIGGNFTAFTSTVYYAQINSTGSLGSWTQTTSYPNTDGIGRGSSFAYNGRLYMVGGIDESSNITSSVHYSTINPDGTLSAWATTTPYPDFLSHLSATSYGGRIYSLGGYNGLNYTSTVYYAQINGGGSLGSWQRTTSLPSPMGSFLVWAYGGNIYISGGWNGSNTTSSSYYAPINGDGTLGAWTQIQSYPEEIDNVSGAVYNGRIYVVGGSILSATTRYAQLSGASTFWGIAVPPGSPVGSYSGVVTISAAYSP